MGLSLILHHSYPRRDIFASVGENYSPQDQSKNTGLSPRAADGGYFLFITLNKAGLDPAYDYADELGLDWFRWTTRRDRGENHPDYLALRRQDTRLSLFVRNREREDFAYLGELEYRTHREFREEREGRVQQEYLFQLRTNVPDALYEELVQSVTASLPVRASSKNTASGNDPTFSRKRRAARFDAERQSLSYALGRLERNLIPAHHNYQVRLSGYLASAGVPAEWERDFVDVRFTLSGETYIGEIKVTTTLRLEEAFRTALGQLLEYGFVRFQRPPRLVMFLDRELDRKRTDLATRLGISVVCEVQGEYRLLNPAVDTSLVTVFSGVPAD